jgi:hypothetical protein
MSDHPEQPDNTGQNEEIDKSNELNDETRRLLDQLDDDLEENQDSAGESTAALLQNLDRMKPQTVSEDGKDEVTDEENSDEDEEATAAEPEDKVEETDKAEIPADTHRMLDELDDELEEDPGEQPAGTSQLLSQLDRFKPQTVQKEDEQESDETSAKAAASEEESGEVETEDTSVTYQYRISARLTETVRNAVQEACQAVELEPESTGFLQMHPVFRTKDSNKIAGILDSWVQDHLPLKTAFSSVYSEVVGAQTYRAGWKLDNVESLQAAHDALQNALVDDASTEPAMKEYFRPVLFIQSSIPAPILPRLVAHLQTHFEALEWTIEGVELCRAPVVEQADEAEDTESPSGRVKWQVMGEFRADSDTSVSVDENQE